MDLQLIQNKIFEIRNQKVMLDFDLAEMYEIETRVMNQSVSRNIDRFPLDFMFQLTLEEWENMSSQFVMTSKSKRPKKSLPYVFTEQGVAMLSGILNSKIAIEINISIMRTFVFIRKYALSHAELSEKLIALESKYDQQFKDVFEAINFLIESEHIQKINRVKIGYKKD